MRFWTILGSLLLCTALMVGCGNHRRKYPPIDFVNVTVGTPVQGTFTANGEAHWYCVRLQGGALYKLTTSNLSADVDTVLSLLAENGFIISQNDNQDGSLASEIFFWSPVDAKYQITVVDNDQTRPEGSYTLTVDFVELTGPPGEQGPQGDQGPAGENGQDGQDGQNGQDGADGEDGAPPPLVGRYRLCNHPDGNAAPPRYGLRLDELFDLTEGTDKFTFDFDAPGSLVYMDYDGVSIRIHGIAYGGLDDGRKYDSENAGYARIDYTIPLVTPVPGDDDLQSTGGGSGTLTWMVGTPNEQVFDLSPKANGSGITFRFGDEDNDRGHRGARTDSGWGWLMLGDERDHATRDWLFTVCKKNHAQGDNSDPE